MPGRGNYRPGTCDRGSTVAGDVFIIGAGFSKAISDEMLLLSELSAKVREALDHTWREEWGPDLEDNVELLLTHLAAAHPWEDQGERHEALSAYHQVSDVMTNWLAVAERAALRQPTPPDWLAKLCTYWHEHDCTVITFNYDTLIEHAVSTLPLHPEGIFGWNLYCVPLNWAKAREGWGMLAGERRTTFDLLKLHGSLNWWYSGAEAPPGDTVYATNMKPRWDQELDPEEDIAVIDKVRLVVPPTLQKESFYENSILRSQWRIARERLAHADRITLMGYSLPPTDLSSRLLLSTSGADASIEVVDLAENADRPVRRSVPGFTVFQQFAGARAIADWVLTSGPRFGLELRHVGPALRPAASSATGHAAMGGDGHEVDST